jgi:23S rRNA (cytidine1920-2'-O)/16S rRNA (cytidine1409-2'-O)-methyltransferase
MERDHRRTVLRCAVPEGARPDGILSRRSHRPRRVVRRPLDQELVRRGLASDRDAAREVIASGRVRVAGRPVLKDSTLVRPEDALALGPEERRFVSRGGEKLAAALRRFEIEPAERRCLDAGASTGGFTDCLLQAGASHVVAVDVGYGQLDWTLRNDPRVTVLERTNVRELRAEALPYRPELVTADLSFISLASVLPALVELCAPEADFVLLVKPQFEAPAEAVEAGGVVRDPATRAEAIDAVARGGEALGLRALGVMASPLLGPAGNAEFLLHARRGGGGGALDVAAAVAAAGVEAQP